MKTAILISGQMRTFAKCYPTQKWQIFRYFEPDIHFFVSAKNDDQAHSLKALTSDYENVHVELYDDPTDLPKIHPEKGWHAPYANATTHDKLMLQHWGNKRVWDYFVSASGGIEAFQTVIRIRPDLWIHRFTPPPNPEIDMAYCPWWGKFGGVNDRLAVMGTSAAFWYMTMIDGMQDFLNRGCPFHPETLVRESLRSGNILVINKLMCEFSTERMDGSRRWAEIVMSDIAELIASR